MKKSHKISASIVLILTVWMLLGVFSSDPPVEEKENTKENELFLVEVIQSEAKMMPMKVQAVGNVRPWQQTILRAEVAGKVDKIAVQTGQVVKKDDLMVLLDKNDKQAQLDKNKSLLQFQKSRYARSKELAKNNYQSELDLEQIHADMKVADAAVQSAQMDLDNTSVLAPFDGIFESRQVDVGGYLAVNGEIGQLIDNSQLIVTVPVPQNIINQVSLEKSAEVNFATGEVKTGVVYYKSALADPETRTFKVEIKVDNPDWSILAGSSADVSITTNERKAHYVSPAILVLDDSGEIGIKSVNAQGEVKFQVVTIINSDTGGVWIAGLPDSLEIITVGQAYAKTGSQVKVSVKNNKQESF